MGNLNLLLLGRSSNPAGGTGKHCKQLYSVAWPRKGKWRPTASQQFGSARSVKCMYGFFPNWRGREQRFPSLRGV